MPINTLNKYYFYEKIYIINLSNKYVNSLFKINNYGKAKNKINIIKKIEPKTVKSISKEEWLNSKLKDFFSHTISIKLLNFDDYIKSIN